MNPHDYMTEDEIIAITKAYSKLTDVFERYKLDASTEAEKKRAKRLANKYEKEATQWFHRITKFNPPAL